MLVVRGVEVVLWMGGTAGLLRVVVLEVVVVVVVVVIWVTWIPCRSGSRSSTWTRRTRTSEDGGKVDSRTNVTACLTHTHMCVCVVTSAVRSGDRLGKGAYGEVFK